jgi:hypothetical protein
VSIFAAAGSPAIAVNDGKVIGLGTSKRLGRFLQLQDQNGNVYTYAHLGSIPGTYPVPKPVRVTAAQIAKELSVSPAPAPTGAASAGAQPSSSALSTVKVAKPAVAARKPAAVTPPMAPATPPALSSSGGLVKERLFADPSRPASSAAGGELQLQNTGQVISSFQNYFSDVLHLGRNQYTLKPLRKGAILVAGTILGRVAGPDATTAPHLVFMIKPAGTKAPQIDPKPILDGWKLLEATAVYRASGVNPFFGPNAKNPSIGQLLLMSKEQLQSRVLVDPHVQIYTCGRRDIQAGLIDRRILATIEFLAASGLEPSVSGLECGHSISGSNGVDAAGSTRSSMDISKINGIPLLGHQGAGSITDIAIRRLLTLQGSMKPSQIISLMSYKGQTNTLALPDHTDRLQIDYTPLFGLNKELSQQIASILKPGQWTQLINRISQIPEPIVPITPSQYATKSTG